MFSAALRLVVPIPVPRLRARRRVGGLAAWGPMREVRAEVSSQATALLPPAADTRRLDDEALRALVERVKAGDLGAFNQLYQATREDAARALANLLGRRSDLEDLLQEVYLRLLTAAKRFRGDSQFRTFLYRVCANVAFMHLRWHRRRPEEPVAEPPEQVSAAPSPEGEAARKQAERLVQQALWKLTPKKRVVFVYHELCGMGPEEIGQAVGTSPNTVRSRLHHARLEFQEALQRLLRPGAGRPS